MRDPESLREAIAKNFASNALEYQETKQEADDAVKRNPDLHYSESLDFYSKILW